MKKLSNLSGNNLRVLVVFFTIFCSSLFVNAQNPYLNYANSQLRHIFSQITYPNNDVLFLYERSAKISDSTFYANNSIDTANYKIWKQVYEEMYYAAHDTLPLSKVNDIELDATQFYGDTIPIGLMDYEFYYLKKEAMSTGNYFVFDTINNYLLDHPNPAGSPYEQSNIFLASPFKEFSTFANPVFRIDPQFFFSDNINTPLYQGSSNFSPFRIDFGDGTGWHYFDLNVISHYEANYASAGNQVITVQLLDSKRMILKSSKSLFSIGSKAMSIPPDYFLQGVEGLDVGVYDGCENDEDKKVIIYLEGIDLLDMIPSLARGVDEIYSERILDHNIDNLRNFNYTYYVVSWKNSRIDIRYNALYVLNLIEKLKTIYEYSDEQFVIIGESMGGIVGRYVLSFMETENYDIGNFSSFFIEENIPPNDFYLNTHSELYELGFLNRDENQVALRHKTRLLITLDSPHQGANIPLSIQHAYGNILGLVPGSNLITGMLDIALDSYAARQMLLYHRNGKLSPNSSISAYESDIAHVVFYDELSNMGYPQFCKIVAMSSGSLKGKNQRNVFNGYRVAGDNLLSVGVDLSVRIFWVKVPLLSYNFNLLTNPNGTGSFYTATLGSYSLQIKLKWFGVKINYVFNPFYSDNQVAQNVKPYCVSAGGYKSTKISPANMEDKSDGWLFNLFSYNISSSTGCLDLSAQIGWNGFSGSNLDIDLCTDGDRFGFVPLHSSLDYGKGLGLPLNHNILSENISTKLSRTPFDVIIGMPEEKNIEHPQYRDERIFNITGQNAINCTSSSVTDGKYAYYAADDFLTPKCKIRRGLLCLEIGDEELYLENWKLNRSASFQTQYALYVNRRNPYYEYPSQQPQSTIFLHGMYSKEQPFEITNQGYAKFLTDKNNSPVNNGFVYDLPMAPTGLWEKMMRFL